MEETPGLEAARRAIHNSRGGCFSIVFSELFGDLTPYNSEELTQAMDEDQTLTSLCINKSFPPPIADDEDEEEEDGDDDDQEEDHPGLVSFCGFLLDYICDRSHLRKLVSKGRPPMDSYLNYLAMIEIAAARNPSIVDLTVVDAHLMDEDIMWSPNGNRVIKLAHVDLVGKRFPHLEDVREPLLCTIPVDTLEMKDIRPHSAASAGAFAERAAYLKPKEFVVDQDMLNFVLPDFTDLESLTILSSSMGRPLPQDTVEQFLEALVANTTLTELYVHSDDTFDKDGLHLLNGYVARNRELGSFLKNPEDFPPTMVPSLLEKLDHCTSEKFQMLRTIAALGYF